MGPALSYSRSCQPTPKQPLSCQAEPRDGIAQPKQKPHLDAPGMPSLWALSAQRRGGGLKWAEETSRLEQLPREIGKEQPPAKAKSSPPGGATTMEAARSPICLLVSDGSSGIEPNHCRLRPACFVLGFHFSALMRATLFLFYFGISFKGYAVIVNRDSATRKRLPGSSCPQ